MIIKIDMGKNMYNKKILKDNVENILPLTELQKGILFRYLESDDCEYLEQLSISIEGKVDFEIFCQSWKYVLEQNRILKAVYRWEDLREPIQILLKKFNLPIYYIDLYMTEGNCKEKLNQLIMIDRQKKFDISQGCIRITLIRTSESTYNMIITNMNLLYDGWSIGIICKDFLSFYECLIKGGEPQIASRAQFSDHIEWISNKDSESSKAYWKNILDKWESKTKLPYYENINEDEKIENVTDIFDNNFYKLMSDLCVRCNITYASLHYAIWGYLLQQYNENSDIMFGALLSGKNSSYEFIDEMVGLFTSCIPFRIQFRENQTVQEYLQYVNKLLIESNEFGDIDHSEIRRICTKETADIVYDSVVIIENYPIPNINGICETIKLSNFSLWEKTNYPFVVRVSNINGKHITFEYKASCFKKENVQRLLSCYLKILQQFIERTEAYLDDIEIIPHEQKKQIYDEWNDTTKQYPLNHLLPKLFEKSANKYANSIALRYENNIITYNELNKLSNQFAWYLIKLGVKSGTHIAVYMNKTIEMVVVILGILKAGCVCVPLDVSFPANRVDYIINDSEAKFIVINCEKINFNSNIDNIWYEKEKLYEMNNYAPMCNIKPEDVAYLIYTSGSTGEPKGTMLTHKGIINHAFIKKDVLKITNKDVVANNFSVHVVAAIWQLWTPLLSGASVVIYSEELEFDIYFLLKQVEEDKISVIEMIPSQLDAYLMLLKGGDDKLKLSTLRKIALTSEVIRKKTVENFYDIYSIPLVNCYGQTECSDDVMHYSIPVECDYDDIPIGKPSCNTLIYILSDTYQLRPIGFPGKIFVSGEGVSKGYWNKPEQTQNKFIKKSYLSDRILYDTGDVGEWTENGLVRFRGREDYQVKLRGNRIELYEIEKVFSQIPDVNYVVTIVAKGLGENFILTSFYTSHHEIPIAEIQKYLRDNLPSYMIPAKIIWLSEMPLLPNGKVDRKTLEKYNINSEIDEEKGKEYFETNSIISKIWEKVLRHNNFTGISHFFEVGGDSLLLLQVRSQLEKHFDIKIPVVELFRHVTISDLASYVEKETLCNKIIEKKTSNSRGISRDTHINSDIAIVGMSCRFSGAKNKEEYFKNIIQGKETLTRFKDDKRKKDKNYVPVCGKIESYDSFDYKFFNMTKTEAEIIDPQQRIFLECAWEALEDAGYAPTMYEGRIGVFAGVGPNYYLLNNLLPNKSLFDTFGEFMINLGNDKDYLSTRVSHKLGLTGPSITMQTACSSSLVCVHMAIRSLQNFDSDIMLAGAVSIRLQDYDGYYYSEQGNMSPSGKCSPFDENANGTVFGDGVGIVVLKRLEDAIKDRDEIWCVIKGSAINNDGNLKQGYTAPSVEQQSQVIRKAYENANIPIDSIGYIETHGTATRLGDPIEIAALESVFASTDSKYMCPVGAVKANIGHTDVVSGIAGLIKTAYMIRNDVIAPNINYNKLNQEIDMKHFYVPTTKTAWPLNNKKHRAGISSFGIGGTNVHIVLEQYLDERESPVKDEHYYILPISAKSEKAVNEMSLRLKKFIQNNKNILLKDISYTLLNGREKFPYRTSVIASSHDEATDAIQMCKKIVKQIKNKTVFLFSGQGTMPINMGKWFYEKYVDFRENVDIVVENISKYFLYSLNDFFVSNNEGEEKISAEISQINTFVYQYANAKLLINLGIKPDILIGHSLGELVVAAISEVYTIQEIAYILAERSSLLKKIPDGTMISVKLSEEETSNFCSEGIYLACVNAPSLCVLSVENTYLNDLCSKLDAENIFYNKLNVKKTFHSPKLASCVSCFGEKLKNINAKRPKIPWFSVLKGDFVKLDDINEEYWCKHICEPVMFKNSMDKLKDIMDVEDNNVFIEIAPGHTLTSIIHMCELSAERIITGTYGENDRECERTFMNALSVLWRQGYEINFNKIFKSNGRRVSLPTYPFQKERCFIESSFTENVMANSIIETTSKKRLPLVYKSMWDSSYLSKYKKYKNRDNINIIIFTDAVTLDMALEIKKYLEHDNVIIVKEGEYFSKVSDGEFIINYKDYNTYINLFECVSDLYVQFFVIYLPSLIKHLLDNEIDKRRTQDIKVYSIYALLFITKAVVQFHNINDVRIIVLAKNTLDIIGNEVNHLEYKAMSDICKVIHQEYSWISCLFLDIDDQDIYSVIDRIIFDYINVKHKNSIIAFRGDKCWYPTYKKLLLEEIQTSFIGGVYIIAGGLGKIGMNFAEYLAENGASEIYLLNRKKFPPADEWLINMEQYDDDTASICKRLLKIKECGVIIHICSTDITDIESLKKIRKLICDRTQRVTGIIHAAGLTDSESTNAIIETEIDNLEAQFDIKVKGLFNLELTFIDMGLQFIYINSSISVNIGGLGLYSYIAAHSFLNHYCDIKRNQSSIHYLCVNWDRLDEKYGITSDEFKKIIPYTFNDISKTSTLIVSKEDIVNRIEKSNNINIVKEKRVDDYVENQKLTIESDFPLNFVRNVWIELIGNEIISDTDNFFDLGGNSILALQMIGRIKEKFKINVPIRYVFDNPTINQIAGYIDKSINDS